MNIFLDLSPLLEYKWTGIAVVTKNIALELLKIVPSRVNFFYGMQVIPNHIAQSALESQGGYLCDIIANNVCSDSNLLDVVKSKGGRTVGIFPNIKHVHRVFDVEILIIHDITYMTCPELHTLNTVKIYSTAVQKDIKSSDLLCCVSEATRRDVMLYLGASEEKTFVALEGVSPVNFEDNDGDYDFSTTNERYVVVLGTIEPRKNINLVARFIQQYPDMAGDYSFVFVGKQGWGSQFDSMFSEVLGKDYNHDKIFCTGFISDELKYHLIQHADFVIYPSLIEGFGLPVIEAMSVGCPTLVSCTSSLVELGVPSEWQFDPLSVDDFARAFFYATSLSDAERQALGTELSKKVTETFQWRSFVNTILAKAETLLPPAE